MALHFTSTGIDFADISSGSVLDDYETGTYTVNTHFNSGAHALHGSYNLAQYTKIADQSTAGGFLQFTSASIYVMGQIYCSLPFGAYNGAEQSGRTCGAVGFYLLDITDPGNKFGACISVDGNASKFRCYNYTDGGNPQFWQSTNMATNGYLEFSITYKTN